MRIKFLIGLFLLLPFIGFSQGEWNQWRFGWWAGFDFTTGIPVPVLYTPFMESAAMPASVSDSLGNFLFYSDGYAVYDKNYTLMPNSSGLVGCYDHGQPVFAVPDLAEHNKYLLFTVSFRSPPNPDVGLAYSIIDMTLNGGMGDVVPGGKNMLIPGGDSAALQLTGTRHANNRDVWIVTRRHSFHSQYLAYLVTRNGIITPPVVSSCPLKVRSLIADEGSLRISPDGKHLVCCDSLINLCSFDNTNGQVTSLFTASFGQIGPNARLPIGSEFSNNCKYVYCTTTLDDLPVYQFDVNATDSLDFAKSKTAVGYGGNWWMQMGPDGKIYVDGFDSLDVISHPGLPGLACGYQHQAVGFTPGTDDNACIPQFLRTYHLYFNHIGQCPHDTIHFSSIIWPPPDSIHWDFGDPVSGPSNYSSLPAPTHIYASSGSYHIELFVRHNDNRADTVSHTINIVIGPQPALGPDRTICLGNSATFDAGTCPGCSYLWKDVGSGITVGTAQTFTTALAGTYSVSVTNMDGCSWADTVQLITTPVPLVTNNPLSKSICTGETTNITLTSNDSSAMFHWTANLTMGNVTGFSADSGLVINQSLTNTGVTAGVVTYHIIPKVGECSGAPVDFPVTVNAGDSVKVSIAASLNNICAGTSVTFTASPTNGGVSPAYQWKVNAINAINANNSVYTYTPVSGDQVSCELTSSNTVCIFNNPAISNTITMVVNPILAVSISVSPSANSVCAGTPVTFTATPGNGGNTPSYQWKVNASNVNNATNAVYTYTPISGDIVTCVMTSVATCTTGNPATSIPVVMTVNPVLAAGVSIVASSNPFCSGNTVTFTATPVNGGTMPFYQWKVNAINVSNTTNVTYSYVPVNGDLVSCSLLSSYACSSGNPAQSNQIVMVVNGNLPAGVTIAASSNPFCPGSSVTFTATPANGGTIPFYLWKVNGINTGTNSSTYTYNPADGDSVRCIMTSNLNCVTGNPATSAKIIMTERAAPNVAFTSCFDTVTIVSAKPIKLKGGLPIGGQYSGPGVNSFTGIFTPSVAGTGLKTIMYSYSNVYTCIAAKSKTILVQATPVFTCGNNLIDIRDNKVYHTVQIGTQCWMKVDLDFGFGISELIPQTDNCTAEKYSHNSSFYQWDELMLYNNIETAQGLCPPGWHIPSSVEWDQLLSFYSGPGQAGGPMKDTLSVNGFNSYQPGFFYLNNLWAFTTGLTASSMYWTSTSSGTERAVARGLNEYNPSVSMYNSSRGNAFSVRCLKD